MTSKCLGIFFSIQIFAVTVNLSYAFPKPLVTSDETVYNRQLTEERPLREQIAEADRVKTAGDKALESKSTEEDMDGDSDDFSMLKSLALRSKDSDNEMPNAEMPDIQYFPDDADSTKKRRVTEDYDSTKNSMDYKYQDDLDGFHQLDGTPLTADDIVQRIATKIYEEDDRQVFDRIVSKLLKLGLITDSQADTLEYEVAEALQDLISKNAKNNEIEDLSMDYPISRADGVEQYPDLRASEKLKKTYDEEDTDEDGDDTVENAWDSHSEEEGRNDVNPDDNMEDLEYFPNFYNLLKSLDSEQDAEERQTLITIMKTLIDFVKMMVKYGTITPEEGVSYLENLDAMIAVQTKNKLGKTLTPDSKPPTEKVTDEDDNTKEEAAKMQREYDSQTDSTKDDQTVTEPAQSGKSETYLEAIRKSIEWLKTHNKDGNKGDYDISKLRDFMDQQVDSYIEKGILEKDEGETIKRIYGSL